jgi:hypothetical protein
MFPAQCRRGFHDDDLSMISSMEITATCAIRGVAPREIVPTYMLAGAVRAARALRFRMRSVEL